MNTNIPSQASQVNTSGKPQAPAGADAYGNPTQYGNEMQEKNPMHPSAQGTNFERNPFRDADDAISYEDQNAAQTSAAGGTSSGRPVPPIPSKAPFNRESNTGGYGQEGYANQQQAPLADRKQPLPDAAQGASFANTQHDQGYHDTSINQHGGVTGASSQFHPDSQHDQSYQGATPLGHRDQFDGQGVARHDYTYDQPGATGDSGRWQYQPDQGYQGANARNDLPEQNVGAQPGTAAYGQTVPDYKSHPEFLSPQQGNAGGAGGPGLDDGRGERFGTNNTAGANMNSSFTGGSNHPTSTATWRSDPAAKFSSYLSHPAIAGALAGGPFDSNKTPSEHTSRHLKTSGKLEGMVGKWIGSESMMRRGQERAEEGRSMGERLKGMKGSGPGFGGGHAQGTGRGDGGYGLDSMRDGQYASGPVQDNTHHDRMAGGHRGGYGLDSMKDGPYAGNSMQGAGVVHGMMGGQNPGQFGVGQRVEEQYPSGQAQGPMMGEGERPQHGVRDQQAFRKY